VLQVSGRGPPCMRPCRRSGAPVEIMQPAATTSWQATNIVAGHQLRIEGRTTSRSGARAYRHRGAARPSHLSADEVRADVFVKEVLARCDALKSAGIWPAEPLVRPRAWLQNFEEPDKPLAALLLEHFNYYNEYLTDRLLVAAYRSLADGMPKGSAAPARETLLLGLRDAVFTPVEGEEPNRTDSGNLLCRKARQILRVPEERIVEPLEALKCAANQTPVVFLDDFIGSGDQFLKTWQSVRRDQPPRSFEEASQNCPFTATYISLVATDDGLRTIGQTAPMVAVSSAHVLDDSSSVRALKAGPTDPDPGLEARIGKMLEKYASHLTPQEPYIAGNLDYKVFGYKKRGLLFAFSHSVPDATLPIFWSPGVNGWIPLLERT